MTNTLVMIMIGIIENIRELYFGIFLEYSDVDLERLVYKYEAIWLFCNLSCIRAQESPLGLGRWFYTKTLSDCRII